MISFNLVSALVVYGVVSGNSIGDFQLLQCLVGRFPAGKLNDKKGSKSEGKSMEEAQALSFCLQFLQSQHSSTTLPYRTICYYNILSHCLYNPIESIAGIWPCIMPTYTLKEGEEEAVPEEAYPEEGEEAFPEEAEEAQPM